MQLRGCRNQGAEARKGEGNEAKSVKHQGAACIIWAAIAAEVGRTGSSGEGAKPRMSEVREAREVEAQRSQKYHKGGRAERRCGELAKLSVVGASGERKGQLSTSLSL